MNIIPDDKYLINRIKQIHLIKISSRCKIKILHQSATQTFSYFLLEKNDPYSQRLLLLLLRTATDGIVVF